MFEKGCKKVTEEDRRNLDKAFENFGKSKTEEEIFYDLCFCICAPQTTFKNNTKVINRLISSNFYNINYSREYLEEIVKPARFYRNKTRYLLEAKKNFKKILWLLDSALSGWVKRDFLVRGVKGLGMKAASHFLRNLGDQNLAIIDTHIIKFLECKPPKNRQEYFMLEEEFYSIAEEMKLSSAELDALIWKEYSNTSWENFKR